MGSPFNVCNLNLEGDYIPDLSNLEFQDIAIISNDQHTIYLVIWEIKNNEPGFKIMKLDENRKISIFSEYIKGICCYLFLKNEDRDLFANVFNTDKGEEIEISINFSDS